MSNVDQTQLVADLVASERLTTPTVQSIEPEIRSGGIFPFCDLLKHGVHHDANVQLLDTSVLLGALVIEWGYDVPFDKHEDFKNWLIDNEARIAAAVPKDVTYRGTYAVSATSEKNSGLYRTIWGFRTLAALDGFSDSLHSGSEFSVLLAALNAYRDRDRHANFSQQIYEPVRCAARIG